MLNPFRPEDAPGATATRDARAAGGADAPRTTAPAGRDASSEASAAPPPRRTAFRPVLREDLEAARRRYRELLEASPHATVYQTLEWIDAFRDPGASLVFVETGRDAMVPFVCKGRGRLRRAWSLPFDTYGGVVGDPDGARATFGGMRAALRCPSVRIADYAGTIGIDCGTVVTVNTQMIDLSGGYPAVTSRYTSTNRRLIRQADERGVRVERMQDSADLEAFHFLHRLTAGRWGARPYPLAFFRRVWEGMVPEDLATFYLARDAAGEVVGGNLVLRYRDESIDWMWVYDSRRSELRVTNALIDVAVRDECRRGMRSLNLGTSPDERLGSVRFKQSFGAVPRPLRIVGSEGLVYRAMRGARNAARRLSRAFPR